MLRKENHVLRQIAPQESALHGGSASRLVTIRNYENRFNCLQSLSCPIKLKLLRRKHFRGRRLLSALGLAIAYDVRTQPQPLVAAGHQILTYSAGEAFFPTPMQSLENAITAVDSSRSIGVERYNVRQRLLSASISLTMTGSATATCALANTASPTFSPVTPLPVTHHPLSPLSSIHSWQGLHGAGWGTNVLPTTTIAGHNQALPFSVSNSLHPVTYSSTAVPVPHSTNATFTPGFASQAPGATDINLGSAAAIFSAGSLAGFHTITLNIGGQKQQIDFGTKLTGAELVAAQQVLSGGHQTLTVNAQGVAIGGVFNLNTKSVGQLDSALGGSIGSLDVSQGVKAVDTLSNLDLTGSLVNMGTINLGALSGSKGQMLDAISAANIFNGASGVISSAVSGGGVSSASISLTTPGTFNNSGTVSSTGTLNIAASSITNSGAATGTAHGAPQLTAVQNVNLNTSSLANSGLISSAKGDVNIVNNNPASDLNVLAANGTVQALNGNINFNAANYNGSDNINVSGGNWLSQQVNFNAGTGGINADVGELTGVVNGTAGSSHVTTSTDNMQLGNIIVSGDPTYFNTAGDITIVGKVTGDPDLAIVASGNIIGNGGSLDTSTTAAATNGGNLTLIAGANFTTSGGPSVTDTSGTGDTKIRSPSLTQAAITARPLVVLLICLVLRSQARKQMLELPQSQPAVRPQRAATF